MRTLVKFEMEPTKKALVSKTLGKIAFLSREYQNRDLVVHPNEYWVVDIINETIRERGGSFWVNPVRRLEKPPIPLVAGAFEVKYIDDVALVVPNQPSERWTFPGYQRDVCITQYVSSVIVDIERAGKLDFVRRALPSKSVNTNVYRMRENGVLDGR